MRGYLTVLILGAGCSLGGVALAQQDVLRGPKVEDAGPPGVPEKFGEAMQRSAGEAGQRVPMRAYTRALRSLRDGAESDPAVRRAFELSDACDLAIERKG